VYVPKKLGLTSEEFEQIMKLPPREYEEFAPKWPLMVWQIEDKLFNTLNRIKKRIERNKNDK